MSEPDKLEEQRLKLEERKLKLEEYKLWVEDLSRMSDRRGNRTAIYVTINSFVFTAIALFLRDIDPDGPQRWMLLYLSPFLVIGICTCLVWHQTVISYLRLVRLRINVLREIEKLPEMNLSVKMYHAEDELYPQEQVGQVKPRNGLHFSNVEIWLPIALLSIYIILYVWMIVMVIEAS
jgi:hypothetical protein